MTRIERNCARLLQRSAAPYSLSLAATSIKQRVWVSALFEGVRLTLVVTGDDDGRLGAWLNALPELELPLPRHFVADAEVIDRGTNAATIELLLVED